MSQIRRATWWQCFSRPASAPKIKNRWNKKQSPSLSHYFFQSSSTSFYFILYTLLNKTEPPFSSSSILRFRFVFKLSLHTPSLHFLKEKFVSMESNSPSSAFLGVRFVLFGFDPVNENKVFLFLSENGNYLFIYRLFLTLLLFNW